MHAYPGSVEAPFPPTGTGGWAVVGYGDQLARVRAQELSQYRGDDGRPVGLPEWHYHDELLSGPGVGGGLYRFFSFLDSTGARAVAAMRYIGVAETLGALSDPTAGDGTTGDSGSGGGGKTDTGGGLPSGDTIQCDSPNVPNAAGTACITPGGVSLPPAPKPAQPGQVVQASSGGGGLVFGILAALAVAGTVVAASAAKHPVRKGRTSTRSHSHRR